ncbi:uncharacterized protein LOC132277477 [Cornus florida]|uniref:uncharacterized protein LOC132277477 n=1 Tax=Cornus florida TaxID=4283 RepID=UPI00289E9E99|nr:uncharacterized protein LOC132277477 [Cornus florida]
MGSCFSSGRSHHSDGEQLTAIVIPVNGDLREYTVPVTVSDVLLLTETSSSFLCNSDQLYQDDYVPALDPLCELQAGQIYFELPTSKLQYRLSASDMATLAVKASAALQQSFGSKKGNKKARISPLLVEMNSYNPDSDKLKENSMARVPRSGSVRNLQRYSSRRAKLAVRSFRITLTTIYEGTVQQFF